MRASVAADQASTSPSQSGGRAGVSRSARRVFPCGVARPPLFKAPARPRAGPFAVRQPVIATVHTTFHVGGPSVLPLPGRERM